MPRPDAVAEGLLTEGAISQAQLDRALLAQRQTGRLLGTCFVDLDIMTAEQQLVAQGRYLDIPVLSVGMLAQAQPEALQRVPGPLAWRLGVVPYSWDGQVLGVAFADPHALGRMAEVADYSGSAVGAYVALEREIEACLVLFYPPEADARAYRIIRSAPPAAPAETIMTPVGLERVSLYDATAQLYEAKSQAAVGHCVGAALLNYFQRVVVLRGDAQHLWVSAFAGCRPAGPGLPRAHLAGLSAGPALRYGSSAADPRCGAITTALGLGDAPTGMVFRLEAAEQSALLIYADNGQVAEIYDSLRDIESLLKDAEGAAALIPAASA